MSIDSECVLRDAVLNVLQSYCRGGQHGAMTDRCDLPLQPASPSHAHHTRNDSTAADAADEIRNQSTDS